MRAVIQRVSQAGVSIHSGPRIGIGEGLLVLLGIRKGDNENDTLWMARKLLGLRIFEDDQRKLNRSVEDIRGEILVISQFTLYGDCRKGRRPGFDQAAPPEEAIPLYEKFIREISLSGLKVEQGQFGALMDVDLVNHGPVTLIIDSPAKPENPEIDRLT